MRILITNDDGINAPGINVLEKLAGAISDDVWVVAPSEEQSGMGHALSLSAPVRLRKHAEKRFSVSGTPTDAVALGLRKVLVDKAPDLILSGVNRGANLGDDITYSGTVSAAMEGALAGIPSIALSQVYKWTDDGPRTRFAAAEAWGEKILRILCAAPFTERTLVNVNFPPLAAENVKGIKVVRQGFHDYARGTLTEQVDPRGFPYFWFGLESIKHTPGHETDLEAIEDGYISVTPLQLDLTHDASLASLREKFA